MINIDELIKTSLKNKETNNLKAYRNLKSEILKYKTSGANKELTEQTLNQIIRGMIKNLKKSEEAYLQGSRQDLVDECVVERTILENLLPPSITPEMAKLQLISLEGVNFDPETGNIEIPKKNMGIVIKQMKTAIPDMDGKEIADLVKSYLI